MSDPLLRELDAVLAKLRREHDMLPFVETWVAANEVRIVPVPAKIMAVLRSSSDYASIRPGEPVWIDMAAPDNAAAQLVLYRAEANGIHYMIAPDKPDPDGNDG